MIHAARPPEEFPQCDLRSTNEISPKNAEIMQFLSSFPEGEEFLKQRFPSGLPTNGAGYRTNNPKNEYTTWYNQRYGVSGASAAIIQQTTEQLKQSAQDLEIEKEEKKRIRLEAEENERKILLKAEAEKHALTLFHQKRQEEQLATHQASMVAILAGGGGSYTDSQVNDLVAAISAAEQIEVNGMALEWLLMIVQNLSMCL